jgi:5-methylcytosine-specific restriction endonuclease McrA
MLRKDGKRSSGMWTCSPSCRMVIVDKWRKTNWRETVSEKINSSPEWPFDSYFVQCEGCGQFLYYKDVQIHHIKPVSLLSIENYDLCWDLNYLQILCKPCHHHAESHQEIFQQWSKQAAENKRQREAQKWKKFKALTTFLIPSKENK